MEDSKTLNNSGEAVVAAASPIYLSRLFLSHFRNYSLLELPLSQQPVVLTGHNGAGKTNLLEAVSLLLPGRGIRRAKLAELDAGASRGEISAQAWAVSATVHTADGDEVQVGTGRDPEAPENSDRRLVRMDGDPAQQQALANVMGQVWLTPQHDQLFQEGGSARRKYFDRLVYGFEGAHASHVHAYEQSMRERNHLLQERRSDAAWYAAVEHKMAEHAVVVAAYRLSTLARLNHAMQLSDRSFPRAMMELHGTVEDWLAEGMSAMEAEEKLRELLATERSLDMATGRTTSGIHRTEWRVFHAGKQTEAAACSTGEQKAMLLSLVLSVAKSRILNGLGAPLLLLDEVVAHLDAGRRKELFEEIEELGVQAWLTGTDPELFSPLAKKAQFFSVKNASVSLLPS